MYLWLLSRDWNMQVNNFRYQKLPKRVMLLYNILLSSVEHKK